MKRFILLSVISLLGLLPFTMNAQIPEQINFQGTVIGADNEGITGNVDIVVELYTEETGGVAIWSETHSQTPATNGYFNIVLGSIEAFTGLDFSVQYWTQFSVDGGTTYSQRVPLQSSPYALNAKSVENGAITQEKIADGVTLPPSGPAGGDLDGEYPNPTLSDAAIERISTTVTANFELPDGSVTQEKLANNVTTNPSGPASGDLTGNYPDPLIAPGAVRTDRIANGAVTSQKIEDGTIVTIDIADDAVTNAKLSDNSVTTSNIVDMSVTNAKLAADVVTNDKIADDAVNVENINTANDADINTDDYVLSYDDTTGELVWVENKVNTSGLLTGDGTVGDNVRIDEAQGAANEVIRKNAAGDAWESSLIETDNIADDAVTNAKLADNSVNTAEIVDASVTNAKLSDNSVTTTNIVDMSVTEAKLADNAVTNAKMADNSVNTAEIVDGSVTNAKLSANSVTTTNIVDASVTNAKLAADAVATINIVDDAVTNAKLADNSVNTAEIVDGSVTNAKLAADAVATANIADDAITNAKMADNSVNTAEIVDGSVTLDKIESPGVGNIRVLKADLNGVLEWDDNQLTLPYTTVYSSGTDADAIQISSSEDGGNIIELEKTDQNNTDPALRVVGNGDNIAEFRSTTNTGNSGTILRVEGSEGRDNQYVMVVRNNFDTPADSKVTGRTMLIEGYSNSDYSASITTDPDDSDDAVLVVRNLAPEDEDNPVVGASGRTAIKTYGDIWANSAVGGEGLIALTQIIVGEGATSVTITPPANVGDPLSFSDDVSVGSSTSSADMKVWGDLEVTGNVSGSSISFTSSTFDNLQVMDLDVTNEIMNSAGVVTINDGLNIDGTEAVNFNTTGDVAIVGGDFFTDNGTQLGDGDDQTLVDGDIDITGNLSFDGGQMVDEITTTVDGASTDMQLPTAAAVFTAVDANATDLDDYKAEVASSFTSVDNDIMSNDTDIATLEANVSATYTNLDDKITSNDDDITTLTNNLTATYTDLDGRVTSNDDDITTLTNNLTATYTDLDGRVISNDDDITTLTNNLTATYTDLDGRVTSNDDDITTLTNNLTATYTDLDGRVTSNDDDITTLTNNLTATYTDLDGRVNSNDTDITNLTSGTQSNKDELDALGTMADQDADAVAITGGDATGLTTMSTTSGTVTTLTSTNATVGTNLDVNGTASVSGNITFDGAAAQNVTHTAGVGAGDLTIESTNNNVNVESVRFNGASIDNITNLEATNIDGTVVTATTLNATNMTINNITVTTLNATDVNVGDDLTVTDDATISGSLDLEENLTFDAGQAVNEIVTTIDGTSTDMQLPTANAVNDVVSPLSGSITTNATNIATNTTNISSNDTDISTLTTNLSNTYTNLDNKITANDTDIATLTTNLSNTYTNLDNKITANDTDIATLTTNLSNTYTNLDNKITANDTDIATLTTNLSNTYTNLDNKITANDTDITNLASGTSTLNTRVNSLESNTVSSGNGITIASNDADLGGNLDQATTITNNGNILSIAGSAASTSFSSTGDVTVNGSLTVGDDATVDGITMTAPILGNFVLEGTGAASDAEQYNITVDEPAAARTYALGDYGYSGTFMIQTGDQYQQPISFTSTELGSSILNIADNKNSGTDYAVEITNSNASLGTTLFVNDQSSGSITDDAAPSVAMSSSKAQAFQFNGASATDESGDHPYGTVEISSGAEHQNSYGLVIDMEAEPNTGNTLRSTALLIDNGSSAGNLFDEANGGFPNAHGGLSASFTAIRMTSGRMVYSSTFVGGAGTYDLDAAEMGAFTVIKIENSTNAGGEAVTLPTVHEDGQVIHIINDKDSVGNITLDDNATTVLAAGEAVSIVWIDDAWYALAGENP